MPKGSKITLGYVHDWHRVERRNAAISVPEIILYHHAIPLDRKTAQIAIETTRTPSYWLVF